MDLAGCNIVISMFDVFPDVRSDFLDEIGASDLADLRDFGSLSEFLRKDVDAVVVPARAFLLAPDPHTPFLLPRFFYTINTF